MTQPPPEMTEKWRFSKIQFRISAMKHITLLALFILAPFTLAEAGEHGLSTMTGPGIDLKVADHAFAGSIRDFVVWGNMDHDNFTSELLMKREGKVVRGTFTQEGEIRSGEGATERVTTMKFVKIVKPNESIEGRIILEVNGETVEVVIKGEAFENNHFKNPTYSTTLAGKPVEFTLKGEACFGYSLHLLFMTLGALVH
jgi:hypothetical protein